jgi:hypothetical protein
VSAQRRIGGRPSPITLLRDIASFILGWVLIFKQAGILFEPPSQVNLPLLILAATLVGTPLGAEALSRILSGTALSRSSSVSEALPSSSATHSPTGVDEDAPA